MNLQSTVWVTSSTALNLQSPVNSSGTLGVRRPPPSSTHSDSDSDPNKSQNLTCVQNLSNQDSHIRKQTVPKFTHYAQERAFEDTPVELVQSVHRFALCGLYSSAKRNYNYSYNYNYAHIARRRKIWQKSMLSVLFASLHKGPRPKMGCSVIQL